MSGCLWDKGERNREMGEKSKTRHYVHSQSKVLNLSLIAWIGKQVKRDNPDIIFSSTPHYNMHVYQIQITPWFILFILIQLQIFLFLLHGMNKLVDQIYLYCLVLNPRLKWVCFTENCPVRWCLIFFFFVHLRV